MYAQQVASGYVDIQNDNNFIPSWERMWAHVVADGVRFFEHPLDFMGKPKLFVDTTQGFMLGRNGRISEECKGDEPHGNGSRRKSTSARPYTISIQPKYLKNLIHISFDSQYTMWHFHRALEVQLAEQLGLLQTDLVSALPASGYSIAGASPMNRLSDDFGDERTLRVSPVPLTYDSSVRVPQTRAPMQISPLPGSVQHGPSQATPPLTGPLVSDDDDDDDHCDGSTARPIVLAADCDGVRYHSVNGSVVEGFLDLCGTGTFDFSKKVFVVVDTHHGVMKWFVAASRAGPYMDIELAQLKVTSTKENDNTNNTSFKFFISGAAFPTLRVVVPDVETFAVWIAAFQKAHSTRDKGERHASRRFVPTSCPLHGDVNPRPEEDDDVGFHMPDAVVSSFEEFDEHNDPVTVGPL